MVNCDVCGRRRRSKLIGYKRICNSCLNNTRLVPRPKSSPQITIGLPGKHFVAQYLIPDNKIMLTNKIFNYKDTSLVDVITHEFLHYLMFRKFGIEASIMLDNIMVDTFLSEPFKI